MNATLSLSSRPSFWKTVLLFGALHFGIMTLGNLLVEPFSGGCVFVIPAYFMVLPVILSILIVRRVGAGTAVFLPYAIVGVFPVYYFDWVVGRTLLSPWGALSWSVFGLLTGLAGDLTYRFLPATTTEKRRAIFVGAVIGLAVFIATWAALTFFYISQPPESHYRFFTTGIWFSLPWLIVNGGFAGYTAYAMTKKV